MKIRLHSFMSMALLVALLALASLPQSCGKIELPDPDQKEDNGGKEDDKGDGKEDGKEDSDSEGDSNVEKGDTLLPSQALGVTEGMHIIVKGYIVGYINGTSLSKVVLGIPSKGQNTNMILADSPSATKDDPLMPIQLKATGTGATRPELNLYDNPDIYKRLIIISGYTETYFGVTGIKEITSYEFPSYGDEESVSSPTIDENPQVVDGR